jgi:hypothetical protein
LLELFLLAFLLVFFADFLPDVFLPVAFLVAVFLLVFAALDLEVLPVLFVFEVFAADDFLLVLLFVPRELVEAFLLLVEDPAFDRRELLVALDRDEDPNELRALRDVPPELLRETVLLRKGELARDEREDEELRALRLLPIDELRPLLRDPPKPLDPLEDRLPNDRGPASRIDKSPTPTSKTHAKAIARIVNFFTVIRHSPLVKTSIIFNYQK